MKTKRVWTIKLTFQIESDPKHVIEAQKQIEEIKELISKDEDNPKGFKLCNGKLEILSDQILPK